MNGQTGVGTPPQSPQGQQQVGAPVYPTTQVPLNPQGQPQQQQQSGWPQQHGLQQPQQQAAPQPQQNNQTGNLRLSGDEVLDGEGVPPELRGRKVSDVMRIYSTLADDFITRKRQNQSQQQPQQQGQQQRNQQGQFQPQQQPQPQQQQQQQQSNFWQNPDDSLRNIVQQVVSEAVQPFQQQTLAQSSRQALEQARQSIPDFQQLEPDIMEAVKGSSQEALANPDYWQHAADLARGRRMRAQAQQNPQPQQTAPQSPVFGPQSVPATQPLPQPMMPQHMQQSPLASPGPFGNPQLAVNPASNQQQAQRPQTHQFFTEAPTAPSVYQNTHAGALTPAQQQVADLAGVPHDQYHAWAQIQSQGRR